MQMSDAAGYFKKYWKDRKQIGAAGSVRASLQGSAAASGPFTTSPGQTPKTPRPGRPIRPVREGYTEERNVARMIELVALANQIEGATTAEQVDVDRLKQEALTQINSKQYDNRAAAKALDKALRHKQVRQKFEQIRNTDSDLWEDVQKHLKEFQKSDEKPDPLASQKLKDVAADGLSNFLGPAGPLFSVGRELYQEFGKDSKELLAKFDRIGDGARNMRDAYRKQRARVSGIYQRWTGRLRNGLKAVVEKVRGWGNKLWTALTGGRAFGRGGRAVASGTRGAGRLLRNPRVLASLAAAGLAGTMLGGDSEQEDRVLPMAQNSVQADNQVENAAVSQSGSTKSKPADESSVLKSVRNGLTSGIGKLTGLFDDLGKDLLGCWKSVQNNAQKVHVSMNTLYDDAALKGKILKDDVGETQDRLWKDFGRWTAGLVERFKALIPKSVQDVGSSAMNGIKSLLGIKEPAAKGGDGSGNVQALSMPVPKAGAGRGTQGVPSSTGESVKIVGGADVSKVNPTVMKSFYAMADEFYQSTGKRIQINSGYRSPEKQAQLYSANPGMAARPGYSMHEYGYALDINSAEANQMASMGLMSKYGFTRPVSGEAWHVEPISIQGQKSAIRAGRARVEDATATATNVMPKTESEGASTSELAKSTPSATPATDARKVEQAKYRASDNYGDTKPNTDSAMSTAPATPSATPSVTSNSAAVAPKADDNSFERVASRSKIIQTDIPAEEQKPVAAPSKGSNSRISVSNVPTYLGGLGMLNMNLGAT